MCNVLSLVLNCYNKEVLTTICDSVFPARSRLSGILEISRPAMASIHSYYFSFKVVSHVLLFRYVYILPVAFFPRAFTDMAIS